MNAMTEKAGVANERMESPLTDTSQWQPPHLYGDLAVVLVLLLVLYNLDAVFMRIRICIVALEVAPHKHYRPPSRASPTPDPCPNPSITWKSAHVG